MLMPIVSMNKMAMNESVATTCCYREMATPTAVYWEVLHGGWIGSGYVSGSTRKSGYTDLNKTWLDYKYDVCFQDAGLPAGTPETLMAGTLRYAELDIGGTLVKDWYVWDNTGAFVDTLATFISANGIPVRTSSVCDHATNTDCVYNSIGTTFQTNYHFESTSAHTTADPSWNVPHEADQFAS